MSDTNPSRTIDPGLALAIARVKAVSATLADFTTAGCTVRDEVLACTVTILPVDSDGVPHRALLDTVIDVAGVFLRFEQGSTSFELSGSPEAALNLQGEPVEDPASAFAEPELSRAQRAWSGDTEAALSLRGIWSGEVTVDLAAPLKAYDSSRCWRAIRTPGVLTDAWAAYPWWRSGELIRGDERPVVIGIVDEPSWEMVTPAFAVVSLDRLHATGPRPHVASGKRLQVQSSSFAQLPEGLPLPEELEPVQGSSAPTALTDVLRRWSEACAWAWLSNSTKVEGDSAILEYFGYRRRPFRLGKIGYTAEAEQRALQVYAWATQEPSPDRILALRQVISLQDGADLPSRPEDIVRAAEPLYQALRSGEVSAVLDTQRQVRAEAIEAAQKSADAARAAAKSAAERTIASLAAVAAIAVANATAKLAASDARAITLGIAGVFVFLAIWAHCVEGPAMQAPLDSFAKDLPLLGSLLPELDRTAILNMQIRIAAAAAVKRILLATFIVYAMGAAVSVLIAFARFGHTN